MSDIDRAELAGFLRGRRARVRPADVGLPAGSRRRTPGLRREEVARLAGMSVDYYVRLEQARGPRPSRQTLGALARALRLTDGERDHLHHLAGEPPAPPAGPDREVRPGLLHLLDRLGDAPAMVFDAKLDVLAWNPMAAALLGDFSAVPEPERNIILRFFTDPGARDRQDPDDARRFEREAVALLRAASARYPRDPGVARLVRRLRRDSAAFAALWAAHEVNTGGGLVRKRIRHPAVGRLELDCESLHVPESDQWVVFYTAAPGSPSAEALRLLKVVGTQDLARPEGAESPNVQNRGHETSGDPRAQRGGGGALPARVRAAGLP